MPLSHGKSKKAFEHNIKAEMHAGKPQKQALAIAYSVKRRSAKKMAHGGKVDISETMEKRPMPEDTHGDSHEISRQENHHRSPNKWTGGDHRSEAAHSKSRHSGPVEIRAASSRPSIDSAHTPEDLEMKGESTDPQHINADHDMDIANARHLAEGGLIDADTHDDIVDRIMARRAHAQRMAEGGEVEDGHVDLSRNADEDLNFEDQQSFKAGRKENYSESSALEDATSPMDSNEISPEHEEEDIDDRDIVNRIMRKAKKSVR